MADRAYFDWNATAPLRQEAREAMWAALALTGNASSIHAEGRAARRLIEQAREDVARLTGAEGKNVTFTSGATEANALALTPAIEIGGRREPRDRLFISAIEHPSVLSGGRFSAGHVEVLPVTSDGVVDLDALYEALKEGRIFGAGLDVTEPEPLPPDHSLFTLDNIIIMPHIASASKTARDKMSWIAAKNLIAGLKGEHLPNCVNPQVYSR